jgi:hypothetical protein
MTVQYRQKQKREGELYMKHKDMELGEVPVLARN